MQAMWWLMTACAVVTAALSTRTLLAIRRDGRPAPMEEIEAIVVFGAAVGRAGPSRAMHRRIEHAETLWHARLAPRIVCCGRADERRVMAQLLRWRGVPPNAIVDEPAASTRASLRALADGAARTGRVAAVSSPYHMHRILIEARRHGVHVLPAPCRLALEGPLRQRPGWRTLLSLARMYLREVAACAWYALTWPWTQGLVDPTVR